MGGSRSVKLDTESHVFTVWAVHSAYRGACHTAGIFAGLCDHAGPADVARDIAYAIQA